MRGIDATQADVFSYVSPEQRVPKNHPLRPVRILVNDALHALSREFDKMYSEIGRPSIAPEKLLRALLLQIFYTIRSERMLMEELDYNLLFRWFVGLNMDDPVWDATVFSKNRERMLSSDVASLFFQAVVEQARLMGLLSDEHFSVDGTLIEAWPARRAFKRKTVAIRTTLQVEAIAASTFTANKGPMIRTDRQPIPTRGSIGKGKARKPSYVMPVTS